MLEHHQDSIMWSLQIASPLILFSGNQQRTEYCCMRCCTQGALINCNVRIANLERLLNVVQAAVHRLNTRQTMKPASVVEWLQPEHG